MSRLSLPQGQKVHTNIAIVRIQREDVKFEIACYPNKVQEWRDGIEKDVDEVLQSSRVFFNVSKGEFAKKSDMKKAFGTTNEPDVCLEMLQAGEVQETEKERRKVDGALFHEIAQIIVEKCVDSTTQRALPVAMVEQAMKQLSFKVAPKKGAKQQALKLIPLLKERLPIERARMLVRVVGAAADSAALGKELTPLIHMMVNEEVDEDSYVAICIIEPGCYRGIDLLLQHTPAAAGEELQPEPEREAASSGSRGTLEVLNPAIREESPNA